MRQPHRSSQSGSIRHERTTGGRSARRFPDRSETGAVTRAATDDVGNVPGRLAEIIDTDDLLVKMLDAAGGNDQPGAIDTAPIAALIEQGCDLDLDVLPVFRDFATSPTPIKRWDHPGLIRAILRGREIHHISRPFASWLRMGPGDEAATQWRVRYAPSSGYIALAR
jgi:hypothetical protein